MDNKYSIITWNEIHDYFSDVEFQEIGGEGQGLAVNKNFIALSWISTGGVAILDKNKPIRVPYNIPLIRGFHKIINDIKWNPYKKNLLAIAGDDNLIKFWEIPEEGLKEDLRKEVGIYKEHTKKIFFMYFHPASSELIASYSADKLINVWNTSNFKTYISFKTNASLWSMDWNYNGSLIGGVAQDKQAYIYDIRANKEVMHSGKGDSIKTQKMVFVGPDNFVTTRNFGGKRYINLFDMKKVETPVKTLVIDSCGGVMYPRFDYDTNIIYIPSKGERRVDFYTFEKGDIRKLNKEYTFEIPPKYFAFEEKVNVDLNSNEMTRMYKYIDKKILATSFYIPRGAKGFDPDLYPDTFSGESALSGDEWANGTDKDPIKRPIKEIGK